MLSVVKFRGSWVVGGGRVAICNDHRTLLNLSQFVINPSHFVIPVAICL